MVVRVTVGQFGVSDATVQKTNHDEKDLTDIVGSWTLHTRSPYLLTNPANLETDNVCLSRRRTPENVRRDRAQ